ncbi:hypothetical protein GCM10027404_11350 [Arthrobacter tumbae]|uniref:type IV toxin-antitoxin system AbiEi family antitoxin domain-containing protein n=1 Tax=Arthrobacter tumbae TaxID=163874 RepID=UPI00195AE94C|nr:type IV toxin-antitoxin system AbiEi family antitoxin domain-containing protein [Arthrobacter tumbae]MBM7782415.1 hypothetical protein [Arthrobacter tumbae]
MADFPLRIRTSADKPYEEAWPRELSRRAKSGELIRIRHGCYVDAQSWGQLEDEQRYRGMLEAMTRTARRPPLFGAETAGVLWGFPRPDLPPDIQVIVPVGSGRKSSNGVRRMTSPAGEVSAEAMDCGLRVTDKIQTAVDLCLIYDFPWAVAVMDRLLNTKPLPAESRKCPVTKADVEDVIALLPSGAKRRKVRRVLDFADGSAMYPGESLSRVYIAELGFPAPELQYRVMDELGLAAVVDFWWKDHALVGEFDGRGKYQKPEYMQGKTAAQVVIDEKNRENRIRATGKNVVRWEWKEATNPQLLLQELTKAGLPRINRRP